MATSRYRTSSRIHRGLRCTFSAFALFCSSCVPLDDALPEDAPDQNAPIGGDSATDACGLPKPPSAVSPSDTKGLCISLEFSNIAQQFPDAPEELSKVDGAVLVNEPCIGVTTPSSLRFVLGAALRKDETGADYSGDFRLPLPDGLTVKDGTALLVGKVVSFRGKRLLQLVNIARVGRDGDKKVLETLTDVAKEHMSQAMKIDGPGIYALYQTKEDIAFVSGSVTRDGAPVSSALITATSAPFISFADDEGRYSIANLREQAGVAAYDLESGAFGEVFLPLTKASEVNPKTGEPAETPATEDPLPELDTLNLTGVEVALRAPDDAGDESDLPIVYEAEDLASFPQLGHAEVSNADDQKLFGSSGDYLFLTTGEGSTLGLASGMTKRLKLPKGAKTLEVEYSFVSQEYPAWVISPFNDIFAIYIAGSTGFLHKETVQSNAKAWQDYFTPIGNVGTSNAQVGGVGGVFGGRIENRTLKLDIAACGGSEVQIAFAVSDVGDAIYDSAALIRRVVIR